MESLVGRLAWKPTVSSPSRVLALAFGLLTVSCSGAQPQDVLGDQSTSSGTSTSSSAGGGSSTSSSGASTSSSGVSSSGSTSGSSSSGNPSGCTQEQEPNDSREQANDVSPSRCGSVGKRDARDFLTFVLKPTTKTFSLNFQGDVRLRVDVDGQKTVELLPNSTGVIPPFAPGKRYMIEVTPLNDNANEVRYTVSLIESS